MELFSVNNKIKQWWTPLIWGILFVVFAIFMLFKPVEALVGLTAFFIASMLVSGIFNIAFAIGNRKTMDHWMWHLFSGILDLLIGGILLAKPHISVAVLVLYVGFWMMFRGVANISMSITFKKIGLKYWWVTLLGGILTVIFSFLMIVNPAFGAMSVVLLTSLAIMTTGWLGIILAFKLKKVNKMLEM